MAEKIGLVGLGLMGSALSANLIREDFEVQGYDIDDTRMRELEERGGAPAASPAGAATGVRFVLLSLMHSGVVREVCFGPGGLAEGAEEGLIVIDTTTARPEDSVEIAAELRKRGVGFLDATLSGTSAMAWERDIVAMVGGEAADYAQARPVLDAIARSSYHLGPNGAGARTKLIVNLVLGLNRLALAEGLVLGMKVGMEMETLLAVLKDSAAYSKAMEKRGERMIRAEYYPPIAFIHQHHKDVRLMLEQGLRFGAPMLLTSVHQQVLQAAEAGGLREADTSAVIEVLRRLAGIPSI